MKDINKTFNSLGKELEKTIPLAGHELRFQRKLERQNQPSAPMINWLSMAASLLLLIGLTSYNPTSPTQSSQTFTAYYEQQIEQQLQQIEINYEKKFSLPIHDIKQQLSELDREYKKLATAFNERHQHPLLLKAMIENLHHRLDLLIETEELLNQRNLANYENSIL